MKRSPLQRKTPLTSKPSEKSEKKPRTHKCKVCCEPYIKRSMTHVACKPECAEIIAKERRLKQERTEYKRRKDDLKTISDYAAPAQAAVNRYVNLRDRDKPCISCGKSPYQGVRNASHFKSRGSNSALRFHLWNIHSSCYKCNVELSGNIGEYRPRLIARIGFDKVDWIESHERSREYSKEYLIRIKTIFNRKSRRLAAKIKDRS